MDLIDLSAHSPDDATRGMFLDQLCQKLELDYASYAAISPVTGTVQGYANYPDDWKRFYTKSKFHLIDPTLALSARSIAPVDWKRFSSHEGFDKVFGPARDFGLFSQGLTVPVRGPFGDCGLLSVTRECVEGDWAKLKRKIVGDLQTAAVHFHDAVMQDDSVARVMRLPRVSMREKEILQWVAAGKSQQDIGDILGISHRTVEVHLRSVREKLGALTTPQAVGRAIRLGYIQPE
ncbi:autoinducer binding domain-containing protein [Alkalilacustris brevis]|uniref:autoinducer binding domain-containing protein n=1 Tax=Alkalilacustris brevis TaxID=2026338 RepID=UPI000E0D6BF1|nr:autoinducer binding domain-containing protein [Alkalilacustris brevis]